jgi:hypothetical protein
MPPIFTAELDGPIGCAFATEADRRRLSPTAAKKFGRKSPIEAMIDGGIPRMLMIRQHIDALRGGL